MKLFWINQDLHLTIIYTEPLSYTPPDIHRLLFLYISRLPLVIKQHSIHRQNLVKHSVNERTVYCTYVNFKKPLYHSTFWKFFLGQFFFVYRTIITYLNVNFLYFVWNIRDKIFEGTYILFCGGFFVAKLLGFFFFKYVQFNVKLCIPIPEGYWEPYW